MREFIPISKPDIGILEKEYAMDAIESTWISSLGKYIVRFETEFAEYCNTKYAVAVSNGTVAIHLALVALGIKPGDEVIVPNFSFIATANTVLHAGAVPVFIDIDPYNLCMDPAKIEAAITNRTKAIIPVHIYGHPADMISINEIAGKYDLHVIEDAAEAHGATINGKPVGGWGDCATFSFYGNKNITTGEGGMITTDSYELAEKLKLLRDHGMSKEKRYWHTELAYNYRMTNIQAAIGCAQMSRSKEIFNKKHEIFSWYNKYLGIIKEVSLNRTYDWATNAYWLVTLEVFSFSRNQRNIFIDELKNKGIDSRPFFYPMSEMPYINKKVYTPVTEMVSSRGVNLPTYNSLTEMDVEFICNTIKSIINLK